MMIENVQKLTRAKRRVEVSEREAETERRREGMASLKFTMSALPANEAN